MQISSGTHGRWGCGIKKRWGSSDGYPLTDDLRAVLEVQKELREQIARTKGVLCSRVFHRAGEAIKIFRKASKAACRQAGCPGRILHDSRRTVVRNLVRAGVPERVAMQMTGHKTRSVFERYNIVRRRSLGRCQAFARTAQL
jgi:hypothetical protein